MVSFDSLKLAEDVDFMRGFVELDAMATAAIWDAIKHEKTSAQVEGIYNKEAVQAIENKLIKNGYDAFVTYSTPIVDVEDWQPTGKYFATIEIEW